ncbi:hypothetical protein KIH77_06450 [Bifidobacterium sp. 82T24]|uniref:Uncharacterized protein n=1 Tax=Bifidobacterium saimiriisciurei TaxID=2661627 RepID=A0ABX0CA56_9BIFI|nr:MULTISPECIES: hypothetical protein [Bifidobacterium]MBW3088369.1 hypothetical protein [Bifidobacterium pluvialisilvae]NEG97003.1 hypothetical protein [Bifidobacterium sp. SMB2]NEH12014.1 hypothetical protein [Bifidobacterium saimiriisciurei]
MAIPNALLTDAIAILAGVDGVEMDPESLSDDVILLAYVWPDEAEFKTAVVSVHDALAKLVAGRVEGAALKYGLAQWRSYHFQHHRFQGARADMRIVYRRTDFGIRVRGFGNRHLPSDIYRRLAEATR